LPIKIKNISNKPAFKSAVKNVSMWPSPVF
jgi:hypothetical protein